MVPISFEFFPPKTDEQRETLERSLPKLKARSPDYVSVTFGAGGSTLDYTVDTVAQLRATHALDAAPHISCMGGRADEIRALLDRYVGLGCTRLVALRGDMPSGMAAMGEFRYASDLVAFIRRETGSRFRIEVACYPEMHPQAASPASDLDNLKRKLDAGADAAITQYFYNPDAYFRFVDEARRGGIAAPIVAGIMPISNFSQLKRFSDGCGAEIPRWIEKRMMAYGDDADAVRELGADVVASLCRRLADGGAPGFHFYTLNRARATTAVLDRLDATAR